MTMSKYYYKCLKYLLKKMRGGYDFDKVTFLLHDEPNIFNNSNNEVNFIKESVKYLLSKNIDPEMSNLYVYYILFLAEQNMEYIHGPIDVYQYILEKYMSDQIINVFCGKRTILIETDKLQERINNKIMVIGCGHYRILDVDKIIDNKDGMQHYNDYNAHKHENLFTLDVQLSIFPDLVMNFPGSNLHNTSFLHRLRNKFQIIIIEGLMVEKTETLNENFDFFLEEGGIVISAGGDAIYAEEYTIDKLLDFEYNIVNSNDDDDNNNYYSLGDILHHYYNRNNNVDINNLINTMYEGKVNIY